MNPTISAIIMNWNGLEHLGPCLDSLVAQEYPELEVIVADCNSKDGSREFVRQNYPTVNLLEINWDCSPPFANNSACKQAKGDYILILNNDIRLPADFTRKIRRHISDCPDCLIQPVQLDWSGNFINAGFPDTWFSRYLRWLFRFKGDGPFYPSTACCIVPRKILLDFPLNENLFIYEDTEWGWRLHLAGIRYKIAFDTCFYHHHAATLTRSPKQAFIIGRVMIATQYICFKLPTFLLCIPLISLQYFCTALHFASKPALVKSLFAGLFDFFRKFRVFNADRKQAQARRVIGDLEIIKKMIASRNFHIRSKLEWLRIKENEQKNQSAADLPLLSSARQ